MNVRICASKGGSRTNHALNKCSQFYKVTSITKKTKQRIAFQLGLFLFVVRCSPVSGGDDQSVFIVAGRIVVIVIGVGHLVPGDRRR